MDVIYFMIWRCPLHRDTQAFLTPFFYRPVQKDMADKVKDAKLVFLGH